MADAEFAADVLGASAAWISRWTPPGAVAGVADGIEFYVRSGTLMHVEGAGSRSAAELIRDLRELARTRLCRSVQIIVGPGLLGGASVDAVRELGGAVVETTDVVGLPVTTGVLDSMVVPGSVTTHEVRTRADVAAYLAASHTAWGYPRPTDADVDRFFDDLAPGVFSARLDGVDAGTGGYSLVDGAARLWGAAVVPGCRHRGVYRGLVAARVGHALERGARLVVVHAAPTSSPILQALGFSVYGQRVTMRIAV